MYNIICIDVHTGIKQHVNGIFSQAECLAYVTKHYIPGCGFVFSVEEIV